MNKKNMKIGLVITLLLLTAFLNTNIGNAINETGDFKYESENMNFELKCRLKKEEIFNNLESGRITKEEALEEIKFLYLLREDMRENKNNRNLIKNDHKNERYDEYCREFFGICDGTGEYCYNKNHNHHNIKNPKRFKYEDRNIHRENNWNQREGHRPCNTRNHNKIRNRRNH